MACLVMVIGESGTGKSSSLRNFKPEQVGIINVNGKPLPFRSELKTVVTDDYREVSKILRGSKTPSVVIDDASYLIVDEYMRNAKLVGYQKYTDMAKNFYDLLKLAASLPDGKVVYFLGHIAADEEGREHFKTIGKLLDNTVTLEGEFTIVLKTVVKDGKYFFSTRNSGQDTVKTPMGMFDAELIDNDLAAVDETIRNYYGW